MWGISPTNLKTLTSGGRVIKIESGCMQTESEDNCVAIEL